MNAKAMTNDAVSGTWAFGVTAEDLAMLERFGLSDSEQVRLKELYGFSAEIKAALNGVRLLVLDHAKTLCTDMLIWMEHQEEFKGVVDALRSGGSGTALDLSRFLTGLFDAEYGGRYFSERLLIGRQIYASGVPPRIFATLYVWLFNVLEGLLRRRFVFRPQRLHSGINAINRLFALDAELTLHSWSRQMEDTRFADFQAQIEAISLSHAVIEFSLDGAILNANQNALNVYGYSLEELRGQRHSLFTDPAYEASNEYRMFWDRLNRGEYDAGEYRRIAKGGREIWVQAVYAPVLDEKGRPCKIIKYANDITFQKRQSADYQTRVRSYSAFIDEVAHGNLRQRVNAGGHDELSLIGQNLNTMTESLASMAGEVSQASNEIFGTLNQLQVAVNAQSAGASQQAAAVNQTTVTLEEIMATSTQTLVKAQQLGESADRTRREADLGLQTVKQTIGGMEDIRNQVENIAKTILALSEQTQQIGDITSVVTNLAQQSKMLAFNASIEAAKAGDAGRGFAVVAAEVKDLAEQSQQSTAQVQRILLDIRRAADRAVMATEDGCKGVDQGVNLVQKSGEVMRQLSAVVQDSAMASQQIVAAVRQEVAGIKQVTTSMNEINRVTAQFVAGTEEVKVASTRLGDVAGKLRDSVSVYKL